MCVYYCLWLAFTSHDNCKWVPLLCKWCSLFTIFHGNISGHREILPYMEIWELATEKSALRNSLQPMQAKKRGCKRTGGSCVCVCVHMHMLLKILPRQTENEKISMLPHSLVAKGACLEWHYGNWRCSGRVGILQREREKAQVHTHQLLIL